MWHLLAQGGVVMYPLGLCSLLTVAIGLERLWQFVEASRGGHSIEPVRSALRQGRRDQAQASCGARDSIFCALARTAVAEAGRPQAALAETLARTSIDEQLRLSRFLAIIGTIGNIAPFIGLFGTVLGIIRAFGDIARVGAAGAPVVARGISEALVATAAGLFVAIMAVIVFNLFTTWLDRIAQRADNWGSELVALLAEAGSAPHP
jgi:biopolymer transport protein ExbB/TolQ